MTIEFPEAAEVLFDEKPRFIALWGGRGSGKSWSIARALLIRAAQKPMRILCARELQNSIADSVHKLLSDQIEGLGLGGFYEIQKQSISGKNGSEFVFAGLRNNISRIKSYEGVDVVFLEEAQFISKASWETLTPTIRKFGSQIIVSFNPILEADFMYQRFIVKPPENAIVVKMNYHDNPWFGDPLASEMEEMKATDPDGYNHIWGGHCRHTLDGAIFADEIRDAELGDRITNVPWVQAKPVDVFFDLGRRDMTSVWFAQIINMEFRILDFYESSGKHWSHYLKELQSRAYLYGDMWLPHDANNELLASERTITQQARAAGFKVREVPKTSIATRIEAARSLFGQCWFDREKTADGLQHLRHYQYEVDPDTKLRSKEPLHDEHSHCADAFTYLAVALREPKKKTPIAPFTPRNPPARNAWLAR